MADLATINASIASVTASLDEATRLYNQAMTAIAACNNSYIGCLDKTGRHISTWRDQRDRYQPLITQYKNELNELLAIQKQLAATQGSTAQTVTLAAQAEKAIAEAEQAKGMSTAVKLALIFGGIAVVGIIAFIVYKKLKKK